MTQDAQPEPSPFAQKARTIFLWSLGGLAALGGAGLLVLALMPDKHQAFDPQWIRDPR